MTIRIAGISLLLGIALHACAPELPVEEATTGSLDMSRPVFVGGHYLSGYRNGSLSDAEQDWSMYRILERQFSLAAGNTELSLYILPQGFDAGINLKAWESEFQSGSHLGNRTDCEGVVSLGPVKALLNAADVADEFDFAVPSTHSCYAFPFLRLNDLNNPATGLHWTAGGNPYYRRTATAPGISTVMGDAVATQPTFAVIWMGMEDIYTYGYTGGTLNQLPTATEFRNKLDSAVTALTQFGGEAVLVNLPDFRNMPYFTRLAWNGLELDAQLADSLTQIFASTYPHISFHEGSNGFVIEDPAALGGVRLMIEGEYLNLSMPVDSIKCEYLGVVGQAVPDRYSLDSGEVRFLNDRLASYNAAIAEVAALHNCALADIASYFEKVQSGFSIAGMTFSSEFVSGNFFSLDGYTPSAKGAALISNEIIQAVNAHFGAGIHTREIYDIPGIAFP